MILTGYEYRSIEASPPGPRFWQIADDSSRLAGKQELDLHVDEFSRACSGVGPCPCVRPNACCPRILDSNKMDLFFSDFQVHQSLSQFFLILHGSIK